MSRVPVLDVAVPAITIFALLAVGMALTPADFARVRQRPGLVIAGLLWPLLTLPPIALALVLLFEPPPAIQAGLLLVAACPIGGISNTYSYLAGASVALSVTLTACSSLVAVLSVPLADRIFAPFLGPTLRFEAPVPLLLGQLLVMLAMPVTAGMWIRRRWPDLAIRWHPALRTGAFIAMGALIALVVSENTGTFVSDLRHTVPLALVFVIVSFAVGWFVGSISRGSAADRFTIASEFATRNIAVATAIAVTLLGRVDFALFATAYFLTEMPLMLLAISAFRAWHDPSAATALESGASR